MALVIATLAGAAYLYSNSQSDSAEYYPENAKGGQNMDKERSELLYNPKRDWDRNKKAGNFPFSTPLARPPTTEHFVTKIPPFLSGLVDWLHEGNKFVGSAEYQEEFSRNYRNAYSTETQVALDMQLVDGYWHEIITKGDALFIENDNNSKYGTNLGLYQ